MGQIKNIKLHIVTDIKKPKQASKQLKMARSLRSSRRKKNKQALRARYKPIYDKRLEAIVKTMQENPDEDCTMETTGVDGNPTVEKESDKTTEEKIKIPRVDIKKLTKFMSQRKLRKYNAKLKAKKKATQFGTKKKMTSW